MEYVVGHWRHFYAPVSFYSCTCVDSRRRSCVWLLENADSFDQWVLAVWILDRFPNRYCKLTLVACVCLSRKYHALEYSSALNRNKIIVGCLGSEFSLAEIMLMERRIMDCLHWSLPSFQMSVCIDAIARSCFESSQVKSVRVLKQMVTNWLLKRPFRSCAWACIVPTFAGLKCLREDDTKWLRALARSKASHAPLCLPIGWFIELASELGPSF